MTKGGRVKKCLTGLQILAVLTVTSVANINIAKYKVNYFCTDTQLAKAKVWTYFLRSFRIIKSPFHRTPLSQSQGTSRLQPMRRTSWRSLPIGVVGEQMIIQGDHGGSTLDFADFDSRVPPKCLFDMP